MEYAYVPEVIEALTAHGLAPTRRTPPGVVRAALSDLYRYEIRRLKKRLLRAEFPKEEYSGRVIELRRRYWLLSVPPELWTAPTGPVR